MVVGEGGGGGGQVPGLDQLHVAGTARQDLVSIHVVDARVPCASEVVGIAKPPDAVAVLAVPSDCESRCRVEVALLLVQNLVEDLIDAREGGSNGHLASARFQDRKSTRLNSSH